MRFRKLIFCSVAWMGLLMNVYGQESEEIETIWIHVFFEEVQSASPVIGHATLPLPLAKAIVDTVPPRTLEESKEEGFDILAIANAVELMPNGEEFEVSKNDYHLRITKKTVKAPPGPKPNTLRITTDQIKLPVPLGYTGMVVRLLQMTFEDLKGLEEPLANVVEEVKKTPACLLLKGEDKLLHSWMEVRLE